MYNIKITDIDNGAVVEDTDALFCACGYVLDRADDDFTVAASSYGSLSFVECVSLMAFLASQFDNFSDVHHDFIQALCELLKGGLDYDKKSADGGDGEV